MASAAAEAQVLLPGHSSAKLFCTLGTQRIMFIYSRMYKGLADIP